MPDKRPTTHQKRKLSAPRQLVFRAPFLSLGVRCDDDYIYAVEYLSARAPAVKPQTMLAAEAARQFAAYFAAPRAHRFDLPVAPATTPHQRRVRAVVADIPFGQTMTYGEVARALKNSSPRAVGGACRANIAPLIIPCHRVVAADGVGGFMGGNGRSHLSVKLKLLRYENAL